MDRIKIRKVSCLLGEILELEVQARPNVPVSYGHRTLSEIRERAKEALALLGEERPAASVPTPQHTCFGNPTNECRVCGEEYAYTPRQLEYGPYSFIPGYDPTQKVVPIAPRPVVAEATKAAA